MAGHLATSKRQDWCTPESVLAPVRETFPGGKIAIDPCWNPGAITRPSVAYDGGRGMNGLEKGWVSDTFFNPPFGVTRRHRETGIFVDADTWKELSPKARRAYDVTTPTDWCRKAAAENRAWGANIIGLIPATPDTETWQAEVLATAQAVCFWRGRMRFLGAKAPAPMACALVYWGAWPWNFYNAFTPHGRVIRP